MLAAKIRRCQYLASQAAGAAIDGGRLTPIHGKIYGVSSRRGFPAPSTRLRED